MASTPPKALSRRWTFITNHGLVLLEVWQSPDITVRVIAERVGITERATLRIISELIEAGYMTRRRVGRNNHYSVANASPMRHPLTAHLKIDRLLRLLAPLDE